MKTVMIRGTSLAVEDRGTGVPILLVHGFPLDHTMWAAQIDALSVTHRVLAPDLRGFGASPVTSGKVTMADMADDCAALLTQLEVREPVVFVGLSMGGYVGWQFVRRHAHRLGKLVLCDTRAAADTPQGIDTRLKMAELVLKHGTDAVVEAMLPKLFADSTRALQPQVIDSVRQMILRADPRGVAAAQLGMAERCDMSNELAGIQVPTLVVCGASDTITPPAEMQSIAAAMPAAQFTLIESAGHMAPMENPSAVNAALRAFLAQQP